MYVKLFNHKARPTPYGWDDSDPLPRPRKDEDAVQSEYSW